MLAHLLLYILDNGLDKLEVVIGGNTDGCFSSTHLVEYFLRVDLSCHTCRRHVLGTAVRGARHRVRHRGEGAADRAGAVVAGG